jgi:hypothetical protein
MARRILLKKGVDRDLAPDGFKYLKLNDKNEISLVDDELVEYRYDKNVESTTLISDQQNYTIGTYSAYPTDYYGSFKIGNSNFHLTYMRAKLENHDYFNENLTTPIFIGIFKEDGAYLRFVDGFDPIKEFNIDVTDYYSDFGTVNDISEIITEGKNYTSENNVPTIGGSGTGLTVDINGAIAVQLDFDNVTPSNNFPLEAYANQTVTFTQASTTGNGGTLGFDVIFDSIGNISSYSITAGGGNFVIDEVITTNDPYAGSIKVRISEISGIINNPIVNNPGTGYTSGDIVTVDAGDGLATLKINSNSNSFLINNFWLNPQKVVVSEVTNLVFTLLPWNADTNNRYLRYSVELNNDGQIIAYTEVGSRKLDSIDSGTLEEVNDSGPIEYNVSGGNIEDSWWDVTKVNYVRSSKPRSNNFPRVEFADGSFNFTQQSTTGTGTGFQYLQVFDSLGNPSGTTFISPNGQDYQANDLITVQESGGNTIIVKVVNVGATGDVTEFNVTDITLETDTYIYDLCQFDVITNQVTVYIEDIETWWGQNTDIPFSVDLDGNTYRIGFKGGVLSHPSRPMILTSLNLPSSYAYTNESYLIDTQGSPSIRKFGDNKFNDYSITPLNTSDKIYFINPLMYGV